jgi:hypothetical protein
MATKPTFSPDQDMDNVTLQDVQDARTRTKERQAYNEASGNLPKNENEARAKIQKQISLTPKNTYSGENTNAMGDTYAKGGMTASKRADGIAQRGKTRGTMVMCGGGMYKK